MGLFKKKDYERELGRSLDTLKGRQDHSAEEMVSFCEATPVRVMQDPYSFSKHCVDGGLSLNDCLFALTWMISYYNFLNDIKVNTDVSVKVAMDFFERARVNTIVIHRLNYMLHETIIELVDILERDKRAVFSVKKAINAVDKPWQKYMVLRREYIEKTAWFTLQDHLRLAYDAVKPFLDDVYTSIRDYMIRLGYRDVEVKARCVVVFLMGKVVGHSFKAFFADFERECGVDYTACFEFDNLSNMVSLFDNICRALGLKTCKDENGYYILDGFNAEGSQRFLSAWKAFITALRDDELMDDAAQKAIDLNPEAQKEYRHILEAEEEKALADGVEKLSEKYNVKRAS